MMLRIFLSLALLASGCSTILTTNVDEFRPIREWQESSLAPKGYTASWALQGENLLLSVHRAAEIRERKMAEGTAIQGVTRRPDPESVALSMATAIVSTALLSASITLAVTAPEEPSQQRFANTMSAACTGILLSPAFIDLALIPSRSRDEIKITSNITRELKNNFVGAMTEPAALVEVVAFVKDEELWRGTLNASGEAQLDLTEPLSRRLQTGQYIELQVGASRTYIAPPPGFRPADNILLK